jgi:UDP-glucose:(heptosyl)LPS alpha-1,3-glucosyltransferase
VRIALIIERFDPTGGGVEAVAWQVAQGLADAGDEVHVFARRVDLPPEFRSAPVGEIHVHRTRSPIRWQPLRVLGFSHAAARAAPRGSFDVVHSFSRTRHQDIYRAGGGSHADYMERVYAGAGLREPWFSPRNATLLAIERRVLGDPSQIIQCNSEMVRDELVARHKLPMGRVVVIRNGVDLERFHPRRREAVGKRVRESMGHGAGPVWLLAGSGFHRKGLDTAFRALAGGGPADAVLWVAGADATAPWRRLARQLGVGDRVRFLGQREDLEDIYAAADALLLPTRYDAFANVCLEAAAAGLAVVTSGANGAARWLGEAGLIVDDPEDFAGFARALDALADPLTREQLGAAGRRRAEPLGWPVHVRALRGLYARTRQWNERTHLWTERIRWHRGSEAVRRATVRGGSRGEGKVLRDNPRRRLIHLSDRDAGDLLIKQFRVISGRHPLRERWKVRLGRSPADREWRVLAALHRAGIPVPAPLALGVLPGGDRILVMSFVDGRPFPTVLGESTTARWDALRRLGALVTRTHQAGFIHGDLHSENVLWTEAGPLLLDLQHAARSRSRRARHRDLGDLDYSLWRRATLADRVRLRAAALDVTPPFDPAARAALRAVGCIAGARAARHGRSRTRRSLRPGRLYARLRLAKGDGMRLREFTEAHVRQAFAAHREALAAGDRRILKSDERSLISAVESAGRRVVVKEVPFRGLARGVADVVRGSAARRAWLGGHGLIARGVGAARPLAFAEWRRGGLVVGSVVLLEDLRPSPDALDAAASGDPESVLIALTSLVATLHRRHIDHGDLKSTHIFLEEQDGCLAPRLIDLEGVRFHRRIAPKRRLWALAQLNASLPDSFPNRARRRAFARYVAEHPFPEGNRHALERLVAMSLARRHLWTGAGIQSCDPGVDGSLRKPSPE